MDPVVHFEMPYEDRARMTQFYSSAFGWQLSYLGEEMGHYVMAMTAVADVNKDGYRGVINGGFFPKKPDWPGQYPSIVIGVADIEISMAKIANAGGEVLGQPMEIPGIGRYVSFFDTEGNRLSILQPLMK